MTEAESIAAIRSMVAEAPDSSWLIDPPVLTEVLAALDAAADMVRMSNEKLAAIARLCEGADAAEDCYYRSLLHTAAVWPILYGRGS